jgi:hypothetical protein
MTLQFSWFYLRSLASRGLRKRETTGQTLLATPDVDGIALYGKTMTETMLQKMWMVEAQRLGHAVSELSNILRNGADISLQEVSERTGLSLAELIVERWDDILNKSQYIKTLETRNANLQLAVDRLLAEIENMTSSSARIVRETRDESLPSENEY